MFYAIAALSLVTAVGVAGYALYHRLLTGLAVPGWASVTIVASLFGTLNALGIGILGEYAIRIYDQVRARPQYIVARRTNFGDARPAASSAFVAEVARLWGIGREIAEEPKSGDFGYPFAEAAVDEHAAQPE